MDVNLQGVEKLIVSKEKTCCTSGECATGKLYMGL